MQRDVSYSLMDLAIPILRIAVQYTRPIHSDQVQHRVDEFQVEFGILILGTVLSCADKVCCTIIKTTIDDNDVISLNMNGYNFMYALFYI